MKFSKFNTVVPYKGKYIYHNSFKESFLLLEPVLIDLIEAAKNENNIIGIKEVHPDLFKSLIENGFIIPKSEDEILKVHQLIKEVDINDELFDLMIMPTMNCNFKCWYCYEDHIKGSKISSENIGRIKLLIENKLKDMENLKFFHLSFFGGEPLLYFKDVILPIMKFTYNTLSKKR